MKYLYSPLLYLLSFVLIATLLSSCNHKPMQPVLTDKQMKDLQEPLIRVNQSMAEQDQIRIKKYIERRNWQMTETSTGLFYQILESGDGDSIRNAYPIRFAYTISLLGGDTLYTSQQDGIRSFIVNHTPVEEGLNQAVQLMTYGTKAKLILAPHLAYGLRGDDARIPSRAILIYDILIDQP
jgi:FKBP-type peptidyl-prolyl cis-trans isomerase FkpA